MTFGAAKTSKQDSSESVLGSSALRQVGSSSVSCHSKLNTNEHFALKDVRNLVGSFSKVASPGSSPFKRNVNLKYSDNDFLKALCTVDSAQKPHKLLYVLDYTQFAA